MLAKQFIPLLKVADISLALCGILVLARGQDIYAWLFIQVVLILVYSPISTKSKEITVAEQFIVIAHFLWTAGGAVVFAGEFSYPQDAKIFMQCNFIYFALLLILIVIDRFN